MDLDALVSYVLQELKLIRVELKKEFEALCNEIKFLFFHNKACGKVKLEYLTNLSTVFEDSNRNISNECELVSSAQFNSDMFQQPESSVDRRFTDENALVNVATDTFATSSTNTSLVITNVKSLCEVNSKLTLNLLDKNFHNDVSGKNSIINLKDTFNSNSKICMSSINEKYIPSEIDSTEQKSNLTVSKLNNHCYNCIINVPHSCSLCNETFSCIESYNDHICFQESKSSITYGTSSKIPEETKALSSFHNLHSKRKSYPCSVCTKSFSCISHLNSHSLVHSNERPYKCRICLKCFKRKSDLNCHSRIHTGEKPHTCTICNKSFRRLYHLNSHMLVHTGEKPHTCNVCNKHFGRKSDLNCHFRVHSEERPYRCRICSRNFKRASHLISHARIHC